MDTSPTRYSELWLATRANRTCAVGSAGVGAQVDSGSMPRWGEPLLASMRALASVPLWFSPPPGWDDGPPLLQCGGSGPGEDVKPV